MTDLKEAIKKNKKGKYHFFDKETIAFWGTVVYEPLYPRRYFITADDNFDRTRKLFSVRRFSEDYRRVETIEFQAFTSLEEAQSFLRVYIEEGN